MELKFALKTALPQVLLSFNRTAYGIEIEYPDMQLGYFD